MQNNPIMEQTVILIKPDGVEKRVVGEVLSRFEKAGFRIAALKMITLTDEILDIWYAHHKDKPFFPELKAFMQRTPVIAAVIEGENVVNCVRDICGPTDSTKAPKGTIRGDLGSSIQENIIHASDSVERAKEEKELLFPGNLYS